MHHRIDAGETIGGDVAHVAVMLRVEQRFRCRAAGGEGRREQAGVEADQLGAGMAGAQMRDDGRTDIAEIAGDQDAHAGHTPGWDDTTEAGEADMRSA